MLSQKTTEEKELLEKPSSIYIHGVYFYASKENLLFYFQMLRFRRKRKGLNG
jgi:hypothetical protein